MATTLITKLKEAVNDASLPFFGLSKISVNLDTPKTIQFNTNSGRRIRLLVIGDGTITPDGEQAKKSAYVTSGKNVTLSAGQYDLMFDKYYAVPNGTVAGGGVSADTSAFKDTIFGQVAQNLNWYRFLAGDIKYMSVFHAAQTFSFISCPNLYGDIASLGPCVGLTTVNFNGTALSGNLEDFVAAQRANGRASGTISCPYIGESQIKWKGAAIASASSDSLSWTATTITFKGETITA